MVTLSDNFTSKNIQKFNCQSCDFKCCKRGDWNRHILTGKHKISTLSNENSDKSDHNYIKSVKNIYICEHCEKEYKSRNGLWLHKKTCIEKEEKIEITSTTQLTPELVIKLIEQNKELQQTLIEQNKTIIELAQKAGSYNTINNNMIFKFGSQIKQGTISQDKLISILRIGLAKIVPTMVEHIHFNINKPEFHNVYLSDKRSKFASVFDGKKYVSAFLDETIDNIDASMKSYITHFVNDLEGVSKIKNNIVEKDMKIITKQMEKLNDLEEDDELQKRSNQYVKFALFDNKETVKDTRRKYEVSKNKRLASTINTIHNT